MNSDYIMRMIEQFFRALAAIIRSRKAENYEEAVILIQNASQLYLNADILTLMKYTPEQLLNHFKSSDKDIDAERCLICAELLYELALITEASQNTEGSLNLKMLSLNLYVNVITMEKQFQVPEYFNKVNGLIEALKDKQLTESIQSQIHSYQKLNQSSP